MWNDGLVHTCVFVLSTRTRKAGRCVQNFKNSPDQFHVLANLNLLNVFDVRERLVCGVKSGGRNTLGQSVFGTTPKKNGVVREFFR
jgi:hypothetical protein